MTTGWVEREWGGASLLEELIHNSFYQGSMMYENFIMKSIFYMLARKLILKTQFLHIDMYNQEGLKASK